MTCSGKKKGKSSAGVRLRRSTMEMAGKQAQTPKAEVIEKQIPIVTATEGTDPTRDSDDPEYYDGLGCDIIYQDRAEAVVPEAVPEAATASKGAGSELL